MSNMLGTTIVAVRKDGKCAVAGDGQVTVGEKIIMKNTAVKVRRIYNSSVVIGFAGSVADAFTLSLKFESKLEEYNGALMRAAVELVSEWREGIGTRQLEAMMIAADKDTMVLISGSGEVIESDNGVLAIGSGGAYAQAAATALIENTDMSAREIAERSIKIASEICVFTNSNITIEEV